MTEETTNKQGISTGMVIGIAIIVAILFGGGAYAYVNNKAEKEKKDLNAQITALESQISGEKTTATTTDETASWKTYTDSAHGFSIKYPNDFTVATDTNEPGFNISINPTNKNFADNLFFLSIKLNIGEASTLDTWTAQKNLGTNQGSIKVGTSNGVKFLGTNGATVIYWANAGDNQVSGVYNNSNLLFNNKSITQTDQTSYDSIFNLMLSTFQFTK